MCYHLLCKIVASCYSKFGGIWGEKYCQICKREILGVSQNECGWCCGEWRTNSPVKVQNALPQKKFKRNIKLEKIWFFAFIMVQSTLH